MANRLTFRFRGLFVALLTIWAVGPFLQQGDLGRNLLQLVLTVVFLAALNAVTDTRRSRVTALVLAGLAILGIWIAQVSPAGRSLTAIGWLLSTVFLAFTVVKIVGYVLRSKEVTSEILFGALCAYLLLGLFFALVYSTVELWQPGSLNLPTASATPALSDAPQFWVITYFSFVTLTTLGFGDIAPQTPVARSMVTLEALIGQLFLAVLIARIVALHIMHQTEGGTGVGGEDREE